MIWFRLLSLVALLALIGCGPKPPARVKVSGTVKYDGKPIEAGRIYFRPLTPGEVPASLPLVGGAYQGEVTEGKVKIEIVGERPGKPLPKDTPGAEGANNVENYVPAKYNRDSTETREISAPGPNKFDFDLKK